MNKHLKTKVEFSGLEKIYFPESGYTKKDVVDYYLKVSDYILPYLTNRPHSLHRYPQGLDGESFYQKDVDHSPPSWVKTTTITSKSTEQFVHFMVCDSLDALLYMVQLGCIEMNPWSSRLGELSRPDWCALDLDPEAVEFKKVVEVALAIKQLCDELRIACYPKTSGKTGIHIYIPTATVYTYKRTRMFAKQLAELIHERLPDITSLERYPKKRKHKVYIDYLQNGKGQTLAAPYSLRPTPTATVSIPLSWDEVNKNLDPLDYTIANSPRRIASAGDLWLPVVGGG